MKRKIHNFGNFMKAKAKLNEQENYDGEAPEAAADNFALSMADYGADAEDEEVIEEEPEMEDLESDEDEEVTMEDLKAMIDDLTERVESMEGGDDEESDEESDEEDDEESDEEDDLESDEEEEV